MYHLHVRDAAANPTQAREVFAAAIEAIRERSDIIIQTSTGGAMGMSADERLQPLELDPEMASLTTGTTNFGDDVFFNDTALMTEFYSACRRRACARSSRSSRPGRSTTPSSSSRSYGPAGPLMHWDFVLGVPGSMSGEPRNLVFLVDRVPEGSTWTCTGIGRWHMPVTMTALALGGNVRLGFEDNVFYHKGVLAKENAELVGRVARLAREWGRETATPDEARQILKLGVRRRLRRAPARSHARLFACRQRWQRARTGRAASPAHTGSTIVCALHAGRSERGSRMAFRPKNRKAERGEIELLRGLVTLANQLQSSLELDAIVHVIATALSETFGFREASVYLVGARRRHVPRARDRRREPRVRPRALRSARARVASGTSSSR